MMTGALTKSSFASDTYTHHAEIGSITRPHPRRPAEHDTAKPAPRRQGARRDPHGGGDGRGHLCAPSQEKTGVLLLRHAPFRRTVAAREVARRLRDTDRSRKHPDSERRSGTRLRSPRHLACGDDGTGRLAPEAGACTRGDEIGRASPLFPRRLPAMDARAAGVAHGILLPRHAPADGPADGGRRT